ncbi:hypothetical protein JCM10599A_16040 [Paraburkholderia kururiensis]
MAGSAVFTMVESSVCMKKPVATSHNMTVRERADGVADGAAGAVVGTGMGVLEERAAGRWKASTGQVQD